MRLTLAAENSIMILFFLAREKRRISGGELSQKLSTPLNHLYKLIQALVKRGYVRSFQGKVGGIELGIAPSKITLLEVIEHIEGPISLSNCLFREEVCALVKNCVLKSKLSHAQRELTAVLRSSTIRDLVEA